MLEEVRAGRKRLAFKTMWKTRSAPDAPGLTPSSAKASETFGAPSSTGTVNIEQNRGGMTISIDRAADPILPSRCPVYRTQFLGILGTLAGGGHLEGGHAKWRRGVACQWWLVGSVAPCSRARYDTLTASQPDAARVRGFLCPPCQRLYTEGKPGMRGVSGHRGFSGGIEPLT